MARYDVKSCAAGRTFLSVIDATSDAQAAALAHKMFGQGLLELRDSGRILALPSHPTEFAAVSLPARRAERNPGWIVRRLANLFAAFGRGRRELAGA